jgi:predicted acyltransferase
VNKKRLVSLDAYRGFVILAMIFVNFIGEMPGIPDWLKHAQASQDTFTIADLVFPGFLFMAGMGIPFSRLSLPRLLGRAAGLIFAGVMMVNAERYDDAGAWLPRGAFNLLFYLGIILTWMQPEGRSPRFWLGLALLALCAASFRGTPGGEGGGSVWLVHSWWGILGMIGWSCLAAGLLFMALKGNEAALVAALALSIGLCAGGWMDDYMGSTLASVLIGVVVGLRLKKNPSTAPLLLFAAALLALGLLLRPWHGISKIRATESFALVTGAINLGLFSGFHWLLDLKGKGGAWSDWLALAGQNALFAYILPDLWNVLTDLLGLGGLWWGYAWHWLSVGGLAGLLNAAAVSCFMLFLTVLAQRKGLVLKF